MFTILTSDRPSDTDPIGAPDEQLSGHRPTRLYQTAGDAGAWLLLDDVGVTTGDGLRILDDVTVSIEPGELVAVVGPSGSGKSTMLDVLAGNLAPSSGMALVDGRPATSRRSGPAAVGFVPQDEVLHDDLPLERLLTYAARLRLRTGGRRHALTAARRAIEQVDLAEVAGIPVRRLSGGQRRRASLATELLADPPACLLDEPTSGLDPATAETVVSELRRLADRGRTVVFVTHRPDDLRLCDRIIAVADGRITFDGTPDDAITRVGSNDTAAVHRWLTSPSRPADPRDPGTDGGSGRRSATVDTPSSLRDPRTPDRPDGGRPRRITQTLVLVQRTLELVGRNRLTAMIMAASPVMVVAMFAVLFRAGAFDPVDPSPTSAVMAVFWVAFGAFFFGLTFGLLQICPEVPLLRRERRAGVGTGLQIAARMLALGPILVLVVVAMVATLVGFDRLPPIDAATQATVIVTLTLDAAAALALGLLASALVRTPAQASLALPMLCFPAVLFSGAVLPVPQMATAGQWLSAVMPDRWAFEALGADLGLRPLFAHDPSGLGPALLDTYGSTWTTNVTAVWLGLVAWTVVAALAARAVLDHRCRRHDRSSD